MSDDATSQVESNHAAYVKKYKTQAESHHNGETALMVDGEIKAYYTTASEAYAAGDEQYGLGNFSIQQVGADAIGLGAQALALM